MDTERYTRALGAELRSAIAYKRTSMTEAAAAANIGASTLRRYINGERDMPVTALMAICAHLDMDPGVLIRRALTRTTDEPARPPLRLVTDDAPTDVLDLPYAAGSSRDTGEEGDTP